jgi:hypothetical protein
MTKVSEIQNAYGFDPSHLGDWVTVGDPVKSETVNGKGHVLASVTARHPGVEVSTASGEVTALTQTILFWLRS